MTNDLLIFLLGLVLGAGAALSLSSKWHDPESPSDDALDDLIEGQWNNTVRVLEARLENAQRATRSMRNTIAALVASVPQQRIDVPSVTFSMASELRLEQHYDPVRDLNIYLIRKQPQWEDAHAQQAGSREDSR